MKEENQKKKKSKEDSLEALKQQLFLAEGRNNTVLVKQIKLIIERIKNKKDNRL